MISSRTAMMMAFSGQPGLQPVEDPAAERRPRGEAGVVLQDDENVRRRCGARSAINASQSGVESRTS
jgi:hypothetical protein